MSDILAVLAAAVPSLGGPAEMWGHIVSDFSNIGEPAAFAAFLQVLMIDLVLAGDNAIVVGALAAGLPAAQRRRVIGIGVLAALVLRSSFEATHHGLNWKLSSIILLRYPRLRKNVVTGIVDVDAWVR